MRRITRSEWREADLFYEELLGRHPLRQPQIAAAPVEAAADEDANWEAVEIAPEDWPNLAPFDAAEITRLVEGWTRLFGRTADRLAQTPAQIGQALRTMIDGVRSAADRRRVLQQIALDARRQPINGLMRALAYLPSAMATYPGNLWRLATTNVQDPASGWNTKVLPAPGATRKYLIFSDLHRDAQSDDRGPFNIGSIDHFKANAKLYCRILDYAKDNQYTVLEAGDCEELWFIRDPAVYDPPNAQRDPAVEKLREIVTTYNQDTTPAAREINVYRRLRDLHRNGRYFRLYGNHDSYLKTNDAAKRLLVTELQPAGAPPFEIYDAFVIPGVKTMLDHTWFDLLRELMSATTGRLSTAQIERVLKGHLGLDANDYETRCQMLVTHGHQFDFWNCEENQLLGLIISNTVASFVDRNMDPFLDLQGLAVQGNPLVEFDDLFASLPILNSWVSRQPAVKTAHRVQHMDNRQRQLTDNIMFKESLAALLGTFGLAVNDERGRTPAQSRRDLNLTTLAGVGEYVKRHHSHHICIGHTHNPHSQPFMTLDSISAIAPLLSPVVAALRGALPMEPMLKTRYFNSGTGGWMEGVIWAIEIDASGQARLVYWTENSLKPEYMDWELQALAPELKRQLINGLVTALPNLARDVAPSVRGFITELERRLGELNVTPQEIQSLVYERLIVPLDALGSALAREAARLKGHVEQVLRDVDQTVEDADAFLRRQWDAARAFFSDVVLTVKQRSLSGAVADIDRFAITAPVPPDSRAQLLRLTAMYVAQQHPQDAALHYAALALGAFERFPRNWPTLGPPIATMPPRASRFDAPSPALHAMLSMLWMFPPAGSTVRIGEDQMTSRLELRQNPSSLRLTVTLKKVGPPAQAREPLLVS